MRRLELVPLLDRLHSGGTFTMTGPAQLRVEWQGLGCGLTLEVNLSSRAGVPLPPQPGRRLWLEGALDGQRRPLPWTVQWTAS